MVAAGRRLLKLVAKVAAREEVLAMRRRGRLVVPPAKPAAK